MESNDEVKSLEPGQLKNEKTSYIIGVVALIFAALAAAWSFLGGACCGWAAWGYSFIGIVLSIVSLVMQRSVIGWWALGLSIFSVVWVIISATFITASLSSSGGGY